MRLGTKIVQELQSLRGQHRTFQNFIGPYRVGPILAGFGPSVKATFDPKQTIEKIHPARQIRWM
jgi:hypothetical protein